MTKYDRLRKQIDELETENNKHETDKQKMTDRIMNMKYRDFNEFCIAHGSGSPYPDAIKCAMCGTKYDKRKFSCCPHCSIVYDRNDNRLGKYCKLWNCRDNKSVKGTPVKVLRQWQFNEYKIIGFIDDTGCRWDKAERVYK